MIATMLFDLTVYNDCYNAIWSDSIWLWQYYLIWQCIESLGKGCLNDQDISALVTLLDKLLKQHFMRQLQRQDKRKDEDYDEVVEESLLDEVSVMFDIYDEYIFKNTIQERTRKT